MLLSKIIIKLKSKYFRIMQINKEENIMKYLCNMIRFYFKMFNKTL